MPKTNVPTYWSDIKIIVNDVEISGQYSIDKTGYMTVRMNGGGTVSARGGPAAESVAKIMLGELFEQSLRKRRSV